MLIPAAWCPHLAMRRQRTGRTADARGTPTFGATTLVACRIERKFSMQRDQQGRDVQCQWRMAVQGEAVPLWDDQWALPSILGEPADYATTLGSTTTTEASQVSFGSSLLLADGMYSWFLIVDGNGGVGHSRHIEVSGTLAIVNGVATVITQISSNITSAGNGASWNGGAEGLGTGMGAIVLGAVGSGVVTWTSELRLAHEDAARACKAIDRATNKLGTQGFHLVFF